MKSIRAQLEATVVRPVFESVRKGGRRDPSLPEVVLENRAKRAHERVLDALVSRGGRTIPVEVRKRLESMVESWCTQAFDDAFMPVQDFEIQCARERDLALAQESGDPKQVLAVQEKEYRRKVVERYGTTELRGVNLPRRVISDLDEIYVPLHFEVLTRWNHESQGVRECEDANPEGLSGFSAQRRRTIVEIVEEYRRIFLVGAPGSGKSTLVSHLATVCAGGKHGMKWPRRALPFVITIRELKDAGDSPEWIASHLGTSSQLVRAVLGEKRAVLLVDGMDEAPAGLRGELAAAIGKLARENPEMPVLVTSRPAGASGQSEMGLDSFAGFRLTDFEEDEIGLFVDKWCLGAERSAGADPEEAKRQAGLAAADLKARIAHSRPVQRIAVNPLLTTILCVVHRFLGHTIPGHRVTLYEKCTEVLLYDWDRAKFPKGAVVGNLDANQKCALLRGVASRLHEGHEAEIAEAEIVAHFAAVLPRMGYPQEDALRIVREIRDRSGLLVERRPGAFAFSHLTFQEYFTALDYASRPQELLTKADDEWWEEVIALACGIPGCDAGVIIDCLLGKKTGKGTFLAAKCMETAVSVPLGLRKRVESELEHILSKNDLGFDQVFQLCEIGSTVAPILVRNLTAYSPRLKGRYLMHFFDSFSYEPVVPVLMQLASERETLPGFTREGPGGMVPVAVGEMAVHVLRNMAWDSDRARAGLISVLSTIALSKEFCEWLNPAKLLGDEFRPPATGKRVSKRAKSTE